MFNFPENPNHNGCVERALADAYYRVGKMLLMETVTYVTDDGIVIQRLFSEPEVYSTIETMDSVASIGMDIKNRMKVYEALGFCIVKDSDGHTTASKALIPPHVIRLSVLEAIECHP